MKTKNIKILILSAGALTLGFLICATAISLYAGSRQAKAPSTAAMDYTVPSLLPSAWFINH